MALDPPQLPTKFPCWCRAVYSWGGETKRDLGFVEGDLIECLNAGDGSWWMGRLRRDRRMMGLFPSNFVTVLGEDFVPNSRSVTPQITSENLNRSDSAVPKKQKTVFRKPFQAHKKAMTPGEAARIASASESSSPSPSRENTPPRQLQTLRTRAKDSSVRISSSLSRVPSGRDSRSNSRDFNIPMPTMTPRESFSRPASRGPSPRHSLDRGESPPPPPPPPHRVAVNSHKPQAKAPPEPIYMNDRYAAISQPPSPGHPKTPSPGIHGHTPSPLRDAMEDVMSSLQDMGLSRDAPSPSPPAVFSNPWSPDAYDEIRAASPLNPEHRPLTSLGLAGNKHYDSDNATYENQHNLPDRYQDGPPQLNNYVQKMELRLRQLHEHDNDDEQSAEDDEGPPLPPKNSYRGRNGSIPEPTARLKNRKSAVELGRNVLSRTFTNKSSATNSSSGVQSTSTNATNSTAMTSHSLMSGFSAGGFSATSAGSYARRGKVESAATERPKTAMDAFRSSAFADLERSSMNENRPHSPISGISYHSSHNTSRQGATSAVPWSSTRETGDSAGVFGGLSTPKVKKQGFFKRLVESAKTGAASARSSISVAPNGGTSPYPKDWVPGAISSAYNLNKTVSRESTLADAGAIDWVQVRRDVNRATSPSRNERVERAERCQMMDHPVIYAIEELYDTAEGDESIDGLPLSEPTNWAAVNLTLVDKSARFVNSLPPLINAASLAQGYVCRPYKSDVQRLRAIFTWVSEKIAWEEPADEDDIDLKRVLHIKRGTPQEAATLVKEMCAAVGLHADVIRGYLKSPGEVLDLDSLSRPNHWWNAVLVDGEWRIMDCSLANPTNPRRNLYVSISSQFAESWYFLARPLEICYTHIPLYPEEQHICPPISPDVLLALPPASPAFFKNNLRIPDYDTSFVRIENLEVIQLRILVPPDVECAAEVEAPAFTRDADGDWFESGDVVKKRALIQPDWVHGQKRYTVKAVLPGDEGQGVLKIYAGKRGLMHSSKDIPHPLAMALPMIHAGENPPYEFVLRHPTPHAQRHDLYIIQPQCARLAINNTFVFAVRQHPSSSPASSANGNENHPAGRVSPSPMIRPASALSMVSSSFGGSNASTEASFGNDFSASTSAVSSGKPASVREKPAKLAIQSPSGKILRLTRKADHMISTSNSTDSSTEGPPGGSIWETVIKVTERGVWRGLVLADRSARWCVFCEWECF